jgi:hypothetical protein
VRRSKFANSIRVLETFFFKYLEDLVRRSDAKFAIEYKAGLSNSTTRTLKPEEQSEKPASYQRLEVKVLTPAFFSRFVHYAHSTEAFNRECVFTDEKGRTIWVDNPTLLSKLLESDPHTKRPPPRFSFADSIRWSFLKWLRCLPALQAYPFRYAANAGDGEDIRPATFSSLDRFVQNKCDDAWLYRRECTRLFLAERIAFGFAEAIDFLDFLLRGWLAYLAVQTALNPVLAQAALTKPESPKILALLLLHTIELASPHLWAFVKGMGP